MAVVDTQQCLHRLHATLLTIGWLLVTSTNALQYHDEDPVVKDTCTAAVEDGKDCAPPKLSIKQSLERSIVALEPPDGGSVNTIFIVITFKNAEDNDNLQDKFRLTVGSLLSQSSVGITFLIIGDVDSQNIAKTILHKTTRDQDIGTPYQVANIDAELMARELHSVVEPMQRYFSSKPGSYYSDSLFFLSIAIHRVMPYLVHRLIMLDADLKFKSDISHLYGLFHEFTDDNVIGIARENQPVYRHTFSLYRSHNPGTRVGEPPPDGLTGFNSGVLLLNLDAMRRSRLYNSLLNEDTLIRLSEKYKFKGHLGDQDFFTLISIDHEHLFYILPCGWNRQLCVWWRDHGYKTVFHQYYDCDGAVHIYHGNCNTKILE